MEAISQVAKEQDQVILFREVNPQSLVWKDEGATIVKNGQKEHISVASKDMHVPGKSAESGAFAGLVPRDPMNSKIGSKLRESNDANEKREVSENIINTRKKIEDAIASGKVTAVTVEKDGQSMEVLADESGRPYCADYDLLSNAPHSSRNYLNHQYMDSDMGYVDTATSSLLFAINNKIYETDRQYGYASESDYNLSIDDFNKGFASKMVHHGADAYNPKADPISITKERPVTAFLPDGSIKVIVSNQELADFYKSQADKGYNLPANDKWRVNFDKSIQKQVRKPSDLSKSSHDAVKMNRYITQQSIYSKEKNALEKVIYNRVIDSHKKRFSNVLLLELASIALDKELNNDKDGAEKFWEKFNKAENNYKSKNNNELSFVAGYVSAHKIIEYQKVLSTGNDLQINTAAAKLFSDENTLRHMKLNMRPSSFKDIEQKAAHAPRNNLYKQMDLNGASFPSSNRFAKGRDR